MTAAFRDKHQLPESFARTETGFYAPLGQWVEQRLAERRGGEPFVLGINGAQGTGKSTLADYIREYLANEHDRHTGVLSIDDLYLTRAQRQALAEDIHPLLATRGVPGTHDVELGLSVINSLKRLEPGQSVLVPRFDKSTDDRFPESDWPEVIDPVDLIIFEGWCVGSDSVPDEELAIAINDLEASEDPSGVWRRYVNQQLKDIYPRLFEMLDALMFMSVPDFDCVHSANTCRCSRPLPGESMGAWSGSAANRPASPSGCRHRREAETRPARGDARRGSRDRLRSGRGSRGRSRRSGGIRARTSRFR